MNSMFTPFAHFLAYGATDQQSLRNLTDQYDGMVVPGTFAAFQAEGTKGFVLSLSAALRFPYVIDPRFPLFQTYIAAPKKSHVLLAQVFGVERYLNDYGQIRWQDWTDALEDTVVESWLQFNTAYTDLRPAAFDKYARRLGHALPQEASEAPAWILPPYLMDSTDFPRSLEISQSMWEKSVAIASLGGYEGKLRQVIATSDPDRLADIGLAAKATEIVVWVSDLEELVPQNSQALVSYVRAIARLRDGGKLPFALYGGYFAVMLQSVGLVGASHGVGFSEYRNHTELPSTGGAPARFYVQRIHRYLPVDLASELWRRDRSLTASYYPGFVSRDPLELEYHELMEHSVRARKDEITRAQGVTLQDHVQILRDTRSAYSFNLGSIRLTEGLRKRIESFLPHLGLWQFVLSESGV